MMGKIFHILIATLLLVSIATSHTYAVQVLTLEECISLALKNNDSLKGSLSDIEMSKQETKIAHSEFFPKFSSSVQYSLFDREPSFIIEKNAFSAGIPPSDVALPAGERDMYAFTFSIKQPIFTGGYLTNTYESAMMQEKTSEMNSERVRDEIILKVKLAYYDLLKTLKIKEIQEQILRQMEERRRVIEERQKEGISNKEELLFVNAEVTKQKFELYKTKNELNIREKTLKNLIGINPDAEITIADRLENKKLLIGLPESKDIALKNRKDLAVFHYIIKSAEKEIGIAESSFYPKSSVTGSYTRQKEAPLSNPDLWLLMFTLNWDIFEWGKTKADVRRARAKYEKLNVENDSLKKDILLDVEERWFKVKEAEEEVNVAKDKFIHAEEHYKNAILKAKENLITVAELLEAETYLIESRNKYLSSIYDLNRALAEFEFSISSDITLLTTTETLQQPHIEIIKIDKSSSIPPSGGDGKGEGQGEITNNNYIYIVQVGAFKHADLANKMVEKLKADYPRVYIAVIDNFNKVRIPEIKTEEEGALIIKEIEKKFKVKPLLLRVH